MGKNLFKAETHQMGWWVYKKRKNNKTKPCGLARTFRVPENITRVRAAWIRSLQKVYCTYLWSYSKIIKCNFHIDIPLKILQQNQNSPDQSSLSPIMLRITKLFKLIKFWDHYTQLTHKIRLVMSPKWLITEVSFKQGVFKVV